MEPIFTNDAVVLGLLLILLAVVFVTSSSEKTGWQKFYRFVPALLLCYFLPALLHWPLNLIASHWYSPGLLDGLAKVGLSLPEAGMSHAQIESWLDTQGLKEWATQFENHSQLYFVASRYLLPASLILLCLSIDFKGLFNLGWRALVMFFSATIGIIIGGPIALLIITTFFPDLIQASPDDIWKGLSTVAGSWIGGGANQAAMKEIFKVGDDLFGTMLIVDIVVANIWMGFLLYGANVTERIDKWLKADSSAIEYLKKKVEDYRASIEVKPTTTTVFQILAIAFGGVALAHWGTGIIVPWMGSFKEALVRMRLDSLMSGFFWLIVISTTVGLILSMTKLRKLEGAGASRFGSVFIYILVATIGMKMNLGEVWANLGLFAIGIIWMSIHVIILIVMAKLIKAPFFFVAVGSQANVGGAASAPVVASAFSTTLAPVGVLMAVLGYALGTYGAIICAFLMQAVAT